MSDNNSLNRVQTRSETVMSLLVGTFIISLLLTAFASLFILQYFQFLTNSIGSNFIDVFNDPAAWVKAQAVAHGGGKYIYITAVIIPVLITLYLAWKSVTISWAIKGSEIITKGSHVETDPVKGEAIAKALLEDATGYRVHPDIAINKDQEIAHTLVVGATRSGKSQTIAHCLEDIYKAKERALVFDLKGDLVSRMHGKPGVAILNPADKRSIYWLISKDLETAADCRVLAHALLPKNPKDNSPVFADNARAILSALIIAMCEKNPGRWDWPHFAKVAHLTPSKQKNFLKTCDHADCKSAFNLIALDPKTGEPNKNVQSIYSSLAPAISTLNQIAAWWGCAPKKGGFSLRQYAQNPKQRNHFIIMSAQADKMATEYGPLYSVFYTLLINFSVAPSIPQNDGRRMHIVIDELGLFPKMDLIKLVQFGGGFGLCLLAGIQEIAGLSKYEREEITTFLSNMNTLIAGKLNDGETAERIAGMFGKQRTERQNIQSNESGVSTSYSAQDRDALLDSDFLDLPRASLEAGYEMFLKTDAMAGGVRVKLHYPVIPRKAIAELFIPVSTGSEFTKPKPVRKKRPVSNKSTSKPNGIVEQEKQERSIVKKQTNGVEREETQEQTTVTTINIAEKETKTAAKVIATNEVIDVAEDAAVEVANEVLGAPEGTTHALQLALDAFDLMADATATKDAVTASSITTSGDVTTSSKKRIRFKKKVVEHEDEDEQET